MRHTVLLVDDDVSVLSGLRRALHREPYEVLVAESADAALARLAAFPVDVVISDESMPGMLGTELLAQSRIRYPETVRILLTGHSSLDVAIRAINEGEVYRFFTKPCNPVELAVTIRQALQQRELLRGSRRLLHAVRRQSAVIAELERQWEGLTRVERDHSGAILLSDVPTDTATLLEELQRELDTADQRLHERDTRLQDGCE
jgi:DNA-binding NtrC family response regulator